MYINRTTWSLLNNSEFAWLTNRNYHQMKTNVIQTTIPGDLLRFLMVYFRFYGQNWEKISFIPVCYPVTSLMHAKTDRTSGKPTYERAFCIRMKSTLTKRGCHFKSSGYRVRVPLSIKLINPFLIILLIVGLVLAFCHFSPF